LDNIIPAFSKPIAYEILHLPDIHYQNIDKAFDESNIEYVHYNHGNNKKYGISKDLHVLNNPVLKDFKDIILNEIKIYWENDLELDCKYALTTSWFTHLNDNSKGDWHNHSNSYLSGVFYFGDYFSEIKFRDFTKTSSYGFSKKSFNLYNSTEWIIKPEKGLLLLFPSELHHSILPSEKERKSMAFNIIPIGEYGEGDSKVNIKYE